MKAIVVYDSVYGNTQKIAETIGGAIAGEVRVARVGDIAPADVTAVDLLVVGSPTHGGRPTPAVQEFLNKIPEEAVKGVKLAAFDTRLPGRLVGVFGYAAVKIADRLKARGASVVSSPEGFFVKRKDGPLIDGELERAARWAKGIVR